MVSHHDKEERKHHREEHLEKERNSRGSKKKVKTMIMLSTGLVLIVLLGSFFMNTSPDSSFSGLDRPTVSDHWHVDYSIEICGEIQPDLPEFPGGVHTHGDGQIHIHPHSPDEAGQNANLGLFFNRAGVKVTESAIEIYDKKYTNGDLCGDEGGSMKVFINEAVVDNFLTYVPQDDDKVRIVFG